MQFLGRRHLERSLEVDREGEESDVWRYERRVEDVDHLPPVRGVVSDEPVAVRSCRSHMVTSRCRLDLVFKFLSCHYVLFRTG